MNATTVLSAGKAAKRLGVTKRTIQRYCVSKELPSIRTPGGFYRITIADLDAFALRKIAQLSARLAA